MKPSSKQLVSIRAKIAEAYKRKGYSYSELGRIASVDTSQACRICSGDFKTFSQNVVQICNALGVKLPRLEPEVEGPTPEWATAQSSMRRIWDETPEGAKTITRMLNAIADLRSQRTDVSAKKRAN